jgi:ankyrin repeat protein
MTLIDSRDFARDRETLDWLLDQGVDINRTDTARLDNGFNLYPGGTDSSLHLLNKVAAHGDIELFDHLVSRGADDSLSTALHSASWCRDPDLSVAMARHLLDKHHMDVNSNNEDFRNFFHDAHDTGTPLCSAVLNRNLAVILLLLERGASPKDPDMRPISYALKDDGFLPAIEALLRASIDPTSALKKAIGYQNLAAANICIELGADPTSALDKAFKHEEQRVQRVARAEASDESRTESEYEEVLEKRATAERISEAMIELLRSSVNDNAHFR